MPAGLYAQFGFAAESTYGTPVTVSKFLEFNQESLGWQPNWLTDDSSLAAGRLAPLATRQLVSRYAAGGSIQLKLPYRGVGLLLKQMLGSSVTAPTLVSGATSTYQQVHQLGSQDGKSLTIQLGKPATASGGAVQPFTYPGCKVTGWEVAVSDGYATLNLDIDARDELTPSNGGPALAAASYPSSTHNGVFVFRDFAVYLGGTVSNTGGVLSVSGGTQVATIISSLSLKGSAPLANERYGVGNAGAKAEPLVNGLLTGENTLSGEFTNLSEFYGPYRNRQTLPIRVVATTQDLIEGSNYTSIEFLYPAAMITGLPIQVGGPDLPTQEVTFQMLSDGTNPPLQVKLVNADSAL